MTAPHGAGRPGHDHRPDHDHDHGHDHDHDHGGAATAQLLDLDAEVLHDHLAELTRWVAAHADDGPCRDVVDLGAGTGTGTRALLARLPGARVTAVDASPQMLSHLQEAVARDGLAERVRTVRADLDAAWPALGPADLVWAAASLHHLADPDRALAEVRAVLRPGGLLAVVELDGFPRFLPDDVGLGRPGLEARCHEALVRARQLPHQDDDWAGRLLAAGLTVLDERVLDIALTAPLPAATGRYAQLCLRQARTGLAGALDADDLATLDLLLDAERPDGVLRRGDLTVRARRTAWVARRP